MNRLQHFLRAQTQYNLHSPLVYRLYTEVLFSRAPRRGRSPQDVRWRLERYYGLAFDGDRLTTSDGLFLVVDHPHREEPRWQDIIDSAHYQVTLDLFSVGIAVANPRLSKQHFLLR